MKLFFCFEISGTMCDLFWLLRIPKDFSKWAKWSVRSVGERSPKRRPGSPLGVAVAEDVANRSDWSEMERTKKTSEGSAKRQKRSSHFPDMEKHKKKKNVSTYPVISHFSPDILSFSDEFWRKLFEIASLCHSEGISKNTENRQKILTQPYGFYNLWPLKSSF